MIFDLSRLPSLHQWGATMFKSMSPRTALMAACGLVAVVAFIPTGKDPAASELAGRAGLNGPASAVLSGDALVVNGSRVQLWGIQAARPGSDDGAQAQAYLTALVDTHALTCRDTGQRHYDRTVARCSDPWSRDVAELMVRAGWANDQAEFSRGHYAEAEKHAQTLRVGMFRRGGAPSAPTVLEPPLPLPMAPASASGGAYVVPRIAAMP